MTAIINYTPPPTVRDFIKDYRKGELFQDWIVGPVGSGKTTGIFFKLVRMATLQAPGPDGIRRTRAVVVRNTMPQLRDTTITSWNYWFKDGEAGTWHATTNRFVLRFGDVECEVLFRALDTAADVARVLSLEVTFVLIDEFTQIPRDIVDALSGRVGRYPSKKDGGATNWGMWGSSNPDTEDNWWFDYLHNNASIERHLPVLEDEDAAEMMHDIVTAQAEADAAVRNGKYFLQPSGLSAGAENLENLPGGRGYYTNMIKGKSDAWVKQFVETEWGFSIAGKPVIPTFKAGLHISKSRLLYNPLLPLIVGLDPGLGGSALILGQQDHYTRLLVLGELVQSGLSAEELVSKLKRYLRARFPMIDLNSVIIAPDPAAANRSQTDKKTVVKIFEKHFTVKHESNNRLPLRIDAITHFTTRLTEVGPALQIDGEQCPMLVRALKGGWRFEMDKDKIDLKGPEPEKNPHSHPGDGFGYLARFFHRQTERELRHGPGGRLRIPPPQPSTYHAR